MPDLDPQLLDELARVFARAAVDAFLAENEKAPAGANRRGPDQQQTQVMKHAEDTSHPESGTT